MTTTINKDSQNSKLIEQTDNASGSNSNSHQALSDKELIEVESQGFIVAEVTNLSEYFPIENGSDDLDSKKDEKSSFTEFLVGQASECGSYHDDNEDYVGYKGSFYGVADGVGGGAFGDIASKTIIEYCQDNPSLQTVEQIRKVLTQAELKVTEAIASRGDKTGGCAFAGVWINQQTGSFLYSWVGDVRIYQLSSTTSQKIPPASLDDSDELISNPQDTRLILKPLTEDQTYDNLDEQSPSGKQDNLARLVGFDTMQTPVVKTGQLEKGEYLLIVSDGIHHFLSYSKIQKYSQRLLVDGALNQFCDDLVDMAKESRSYDDCSVLILQRQSEQKVNVLPNDLTSNNVPPDDLSYTEDDALLKEFESTNTQSSNLNNPDSFFDITEHSAYADSNKKVKADNKHIVIQSGIEISKLGLICFALLSGILGGVIGSLLVNPTLLDSYIIMATDIISSYQQ